MSREELLELKELLERRARLEGDYTLASGVKSHFYYDATRVTLWPRGAYLVGSLLYDMIAGARAEAVGGLAVGADAIANAVAVVSELRGNPIPAFVVRDTDPKDHGTKDLIPSSFAPDGDLIREGRRIAIVDDIITAGGSIRRALRAVEDLGAHVILVIALIDRLQGGSDILRKEGYPLRALFRTDPNGYLIAD